MAWPKPDLNVPGTLTGPSKKPQFSLKGIIEEYRKLVCSTSGVICLSVCVLVSHHFAGSRRYT